MNNSKYNKAVRATSNSMSANPSSTYTLDGRVYNSEKYSGPLAPRRSVIDHMYANERVCAADIFNIERMLEGKTPSIISKQHRERIVEKYNLQYDKKGHRWIGDKETIFNQMCEEYPNAAKYKKYSGLLYAMRYGDNPCITYKGGDNK